MTQEVDCRHAIIQILYLLSSPDKQLAYERNVPQVRVTDELLSMWFDDTYLPESKAFKESFSEKELRALAAFNDFYDERSKLLPSLGADVTSWLKSETWLQIMARAQETLALFKSRVDL
jgi:hypothetical protein